MGGRVRELQSYRVRAGSAAHLLLAHAPRGGGTRLPHARAFPEYMYAAGGGGFRELLAPERVVLAVLRGNGGMRGRQEGAAVLRGALCGAGRADSTVA